MLAREGRYFRRNAVKAMTLARENANDTQDPIHCEFISRDYPKTCYVFFAYASSLFSNYQEYREIRKNLMLQYATVLTYSKSDFRHILYIAMDSANGRNRDEDFAYFENNRPLTKEHKAEAKKLRRDNKILSERYREKLDNPIFKDMPSTGDNIQMSETRKRIGRNCPCPCGSGNKYKKCCMRLGRY